MWGLQLLIEELWKWDKEEKQEVKEEKEEKKKRADIHRREIENKQSLPRKQHHISLIIQIRVS